MQGLEAKTYVRDWDVKGLGAGGDLGHIVVDKLWTQCGGTSRTSAHDQHTEKGGGATVMTTRWQGKHGVEGHGCVVVGCAIVGSKPHIHD